MASNLITALAGLGGAIIGSTATIATTWLTHTVDRF